MNNKKRKRRVEPENSIFTKMVKLTNTEIKRRSSQHDHHYIEFGVAKPTEDDKIETNDIPQRPMMMVLQDLIRTNSPLLVITSAIADAETDYEYIVDDHKVNILPEPKAKLWDYQEEAVRFIGNREMDTANVGCRGLMLCDDMGLGKTLESLTYVYRNIQQRQRETGRRFNGVTLIVVPCIILGTWIKEIENSFPPNSLHYIKMMGDKTPVPDRLHIENCTDIIFTTYTVVSLVYKALYCGEDIEDDDDDDEKRNIEDPKNIMHRYGVLYDIVFTRVILDEAHYIVNMNTSRFKALKKIRARSKWMNTGTPVQNSYANIMACFIFIGLILSINPTDMNSLSGSDELYIKDILEKVMIRRLKHQIKWDHDHVPFFLNDVDKQIIFIDFDTNQERILYLMYAEYALSKMKKQSRTKITQYDGEKNLTIMPAIQLTRHCCIDFHIVRKHIIPNGMLLGPNASTLEVKPTSFGEKLFFDESCHYEHIDKDNADLEQRAFNHNRKTTYHYESNVEDNVVKTTYEWDPYRYDSSLIDLENDAFSRQLCTTIYELIRDDGFRDLEAITRHVMSMMGMNDDNDEDLIRKQIEAIYIHLTDRILPEYSTKQRQVLKYISEIEDPTDKTIIFSDSVCFLKGMVKCLTAHNYKSSIVTGDYTKISDCEAQLERSRSDPNVKVLLVSLKKGNVGLNVTWVNHVLFCSPWYNPQSESQAECRNQRIGQTKQVHIRYFILRNTIEERILGLSKYKKNISYHLIDNHDEDNSENSDVLNVINTVDDLIRTRLFDFKLTIT